MRALAVHVERAAVVLLAQNVVVIAVDARGFVRLGAEHVAEDVHERVDQRATVELGEGARPGVIVQVGAARLRVGLDPHHTARRVDRTRRTMVQPDRGADAARAGVREHPQAVVLDVALDLHEVVPLSQGAELERHLLATQSLEPRIAQRRLQRFGEAAFHVRTRVTQHGDARVEAVEHLCRA